MGPFNWSHAITVALAFLGYVLVLVKGWQSLRDRLKDIGAQIAAQDMRIEALASEKVPLLECHDKHAKEREENRAEHEVLNRNLVRLSAQGVQPANPHPQLEPLPDPRERED